MRTNIINTIYKKELREVLRDKRTLFLIILLPFFLYPVLFYVMGAVGQSQNEKMSQETVTVLLNPAAENTPVYEMLKQLPYLDVRLEAFDEARVDTMKNAIGVAVADGFNTQLQNGASTTVTLYADESRDLIETRVRTLKKSIEQLNQQLLSQRLSEAELSQDFIAPIRLEEKDLSSVEEKIGKAIGGFLPFILLLFIFTGSIYIAIDITAGEKERRTLQTLFTAPLLVREIIAGKFLAVLTVGLVSAAMNVLSLIVALNIQVQLLGEGSIGLLQLSVAPAGWIWIALILIFATVFIAALSLSVVLLANSYKEAQSYVSPLMILIIIPAVLGGMPGMELTTSTALVPLLNISLAIAEVLKGTVNHGLLAMVTAFAALYGLLALYLASLIFGNESVITGEKVSFVQLFKRS